MRILTLIVVVLVVAFSAMSPAAAQPTGNNVEAARAAEAAAREAFRKKNYAVAAEGFAAAFRLDPKANTKYNEALAWSKGEQLPAAADAYEAALTFGGLDEKLRKKATAGLAALKTKLGRVAIAEPLGGTVSVGHAVERGIPANIHLEPGKHEVEAKLPNGQTQSKTITVVAGAQIDLAFESTGPTPSPGPTPEPTPAPTTPPPESDPALAIAGWSFVGLGAASLIAMGVTGGLTLSKVSKYDDTGNTDATLHDEAVTLKTTTNVLVGVGGGFVAVGAILLIIHATTGDSEAAQNPLTFRF